MSVNVEGGRVSEDHVYQKAISQFSFQWELILLLRVGGRRVMWLEN